LNGKKQVGEVGKLKWRGKIKMPFYCTECGEKESFRATQYYTVPRGGSCTAYFDADGAVTDRENYEDNEDDGDCDYGDMEDIECNECGSSVEEYSEEEITAMEADRLHEEQRANPIKSWKEEMKV
jgi:hypothetical protein